MKKKISVSMSKEALKMLNAAAEANDISVSEMTERSVRFAYQRPGERMNPLTAKPFDDVKNATVDQLVTAVKLGGSAFQFDGFTTPEKWPFVVVIAVAKPGNEKAIELAHEFSKKMTQAAKWAQKAANPGLKKKTREVLPLHEWTAAPDADEAHCRNCGVKATQAGTFCPQFHLSKKNKKKAKR